MALKKTVIARLAVLAKVDQTALETALAAADEQDVVIADNLQTISSTDLDNRDRNKYNEGKTAGTEIAMKDLKTKHNLTVDGVDPDKIVEAIGKKAVDEAKIAPDEQVKTAKQLTEQWKTKATTAEERATQLEKEKGELSKDNRYRSLLPKDRSDILNDDEFLMTVKGRYDIQTKEGKEVVIDRTTGEIVRDKTKLEPVAPADVIKGHFTERKWLVDPKAVDPRGGRGGGNSGPSGGKGQFTKISEVNKHIEEQGKSIQGKDGQALLRGILKDNPDIDMHS